MDHSFAGWNFQHLPIYNFQARGVCFPNLSTRARPDGVHIVRPTLRKQTCESIMAAPRSGINISLTAPPDGKWAELSKAKDMDL